MYYKNTGNKKSCFFYLYNKFKNKGQTVLHTYKKDRGDYIVKKTNFKLYKYISKQ